MFMKCLATAHSIGITFCTSLATTTSLLLQVLMEWREVQVLMEWGEVHVELDCLDQYFGEFGGLAM